MRARLVPPPSREEIGAAIAAGQASEDGVHLARDAGELRRAIRACPEGDRDGRRWLIRRAYDLGCVGELPAGWGRGRVRVRRDT